MADPSRELARRFGDALGRAFGADAADANPALHPSAHADYQADVALGLGKRLRRPPRQVADALVAALDVRDLCAAVTIAGPGFVNLTLDDGWMAAQLGRMLADPRLDVPHGKPADRVIVDYSSPNVAKEMHVGHIRGTVIGDALCRVLAFLGHDVLRQNHLGDWGTPFGMLIEHMLDSSAGAGAGETDISDLNAFYQEARAKFDADVAFAERARRRVVALQGGDPPSRALWQRLCDVSLGHIDSVYARLGVLLERSDIVPESFYQPRLAEVIDELGKLGLLEESEGALCAFPDGFTGREGARVPLIVRKQDGGYGYATTDLCALRYRTRELRGTRLLYVVGAPQAMHLGMVAAVGRRADWVDAGVRVEHVAFGAVLGPDGKMLKTRSGESVRLTDLLDEAGERAAAVLAQKAPDMDPTERAAIARAVGVGAVKYADLSTERIKDYMFSWDKMLAFDGNTAPYLMYAHARIRSILRRADASGSAAAPRLGRPTAPAERALALQLLELASILARTAETAEPHRLAGYLHRLATAFTGFYESCPVLKADGPEREHRLALCGLTAAALARGLDLLGIEAPERM